LTAENQIQNSLRDQFGFEEIIRSQEDIYKNASCLDLSNITFIEPYSMLSLLLIGRNFLRQKGERLKLVNIPLNILQYLYRMDFNKTGIFEFNEKVPDQMLLKRSAFSKSIIEINEIPNKERESVKVISDVIKLFRKRASYILRFWFDANLIDYFVTVISELCQNIFEHSLDSGFITLQSYSNGRANTVRLVISDSGIGIIKSFEKTEVEYSSSADLIKKAMTTPISSKRKNGYGLCQVYSIMEKIKGDIFIRSESASVAIMFSKSKNTPNVFVKDNLNYFNGTQISLSLTA
jgi:anti-sigma regulatory factor (Ser/Thr protein kinase)/anti-anti-sigma regulatory factor